LYKKWKSLIKIDSRCALKVTGVMIKVRIRKQENDDYNYNLILDDYY